MDPHVYSSFQKALDLPLSANQSDFEEKVADFQFSVVHSELFSEILDALSNQSDQLATIEPTDLRDDQVLAALNYMFSEETTHLRYGKYWPSYSSIATSFIANITDMKFVQKLRPIDDLELRNAFNSMGELSGSWKTCTDAMIHLNLFLGNFKGIKRCLNSIIQVEGQNWIKMALTSTRGVR